LHQIKAPTLVTVGNQDIFTLLKLSKEIAKWIPNNELTIIKGGAHTHHWKKRDEFNRKTLEFLLNNN